MRIILGLLFILITNYLSSQAKKPVYYQDENKNYISKKVFLKKYRNRKDDIGYFKLNFTNDTCNIQRLVKRKNFGRLSNLKLKQLYQSITTNNNIPTEKYTIIQYHPGKDRCNGGDTGNRGYRYSKHYLKKLKKSFDYKHFWIHKRDSQLDFENSSVDWIADENRSVETFFFKYHYPCFSFVIINNETGLFISNFGEYGDYTVLEIAEEMKKSSR